MAIPKKKRILARMDASVTRTMAHGFTDFPKAIGEGVTNPADAAKRMKPEPMPLRELDVVITFKEEMVGGKKTRRVEIVDNASGGDEQAMSDIISLGSSSSRGVKGTKGKIGSGRLGALNHCESLTYEMKPALGPLYRVSFDFESLHAMIQSGGGDWEVLDLPPNHPVKVRGTRVIYNNLGGGRGDKDQDRSPERLIAELAEFIDVDLAERVTVIDYAGKRHKLMPRELRGNPIRMELTGKYCGPVRVSLAVGTTTSGNRVVFSAQGSGCSLADFLRKIAKDRRYSELVKPLLTVLCHPQVMGTIDASDANEWIGGDRESFLSDIYGNVKFMVDLLTLLVREVIPPVEAQIGQRADQLVQTRDEDLLADVISQIHDVTGGPPKDRAKVTAGPDTMSKHITLELGGDGAVFEIPQTGTKEDLVWDTSACGGVLNVARGPRVEYDPKTITRRGKPHMLVCRRVRDSHVVLIVYIHVVEELPLSLATPRATMDVNERRLFSIERPLPKRCAKRRFAWSCDAHAGTLEVSEDTLSAYFTSSNNTGEWTIRVEDTRDPETYAIATVDVELGYQRKAKRSQASHTDFTWNGHLFVVSTTRLTSEDAMEQLSQLFAGTTFSTITINLGHPAFDVKEDESRRCVFRMQIAMRLAEHENPHADPAELTAKMATVIAKLAGRC